MESSAREAFAAVIAFTEASPMGAMGFRMCTGFKLWERFIADHPNATVREFLNEFERRQRKHQHQSWPLALMESIGKDADAEVRARIVGIAEGNAAQNLLGHKEWRLTEVELETVRANRRKGNPTLGVKADANAKQPGRPV